MNFDSDLTNTTPFDLAPELGSEAAIGANSAFQGVTVETERVEGRRCQITAQIQIPHSVENIWTILTDYEKLADFIPSLAKSQQIEHPQGGIRLEQVGSQSFLRLKFCARVVLDMVEQFPNRIDFQMVEGDFREFFGSWLLQPRLVEEKSGTELQYVVQILPARTMPIALIERRLSHNLVMNLTAIQARANSLFGT
jgi:ribosome-associated toxin RatA of RatAB toxin-antitoxin module